MKCRLCSKQEGDDKPYVCTDCYEIIKPLIEVRMEQLARLQRRRESASADNLMKGDW